MVDRKKAARHISRISNKIRREFDRSPVIKEISAAEARALYFLIDRGDEPTFQRDIEEEYCLRPPSASRLLSKMESDGLIKRVSIKDDARYKKIEVTKKGLKYKDEVLRKLRKLEQILTKDISDKELEVFYKVMEKMESNLP